MNEIKKELLELEFNVNSIGLIYWVEAIKHIQKNPLCWDVMDIYDYIAKKYNTTGINVERCLRHAITPAKKNIQENTNIINLLRIKHF